LASSLAQVEDTVAHCAPTCASTDLDPSAWPNWTNACRLWVSLARRYKRTPAELPACWQAGKKSWPDWTLQPTWRAGSCRKAAHAAYLAEAKKAEQGCAPRPPPCWPKAITQAMQGLGMQGGRFEVALEKSAPNPQQSGLEEVAFLVAGHAGSTPSPWARWPRAASCRALHWPLPSPPASWARANPDF
jgi:DNA repair protein RecN (Recombination protein N)